jgi:glycosyltransferase involved in cell wall biosynthesis
LPNQQAIRHLLEDVLPLVLPLLPQQLQQQFKVHIVGGTDQVPVQLAQLFQTHADRVVFHGWLDDDLLHMLYTRVKVVVAPLLAGAGVKGKVSTLQVTQALSFCSANLLC